MDKEHRGQPGAGGGGEPRGMHHRVPAGALFKAVLAVLAWGASFIATKIALRSLPVGGVIWLRFGIGALVLVGFALARRERFRVPARTLGAFAFLGFLGIAFHQWVQVNGLVTARASTAAWIITTTPVFIALLGRFTLGESLGLLRWGGIALAACGVLLVTSGGDLAEFLRGSMETTGDLLVLASAANWAVFSVLSRRILRHQSPTLAMLYVIVAGWLFSSLLLPGPGEAAGRLSAMPAEAWWSIAFLGIVCSGMAYVYWYDALKILPASRVGALLYLEPLVSVVLARALLAEPVGAGVLGGGFLILAGVWLVNRPALRPRPGAGEREGGKAGP